MMQSMLLVYVTKAPIFRKLGISRTLSLYVETSLSNFRILPPFQFLSMTSSIHLIYSFILLVFGPP